MNSNDVASALVAVVLCVMTGLVLIFRGPLGKAFARRIEGRSAEDHALVARIEDLEHRLRAAEQDSARVAELEERLDFAERTLIKAPERVERGGP